MNTPNNNTEPDKTTPIPPNREQLLADAEQNLAAARERFERSVDGTIGVEEEFGICNPETLDLEQRFTEIEAIAEANGLSTEISGELLASEVEFRTGRCETWGDAVEELTGIRARAAGAARAINAVLASTGTHPWADYRKQEVVPLAYYKLLVSRLQYAAWRNVTFGLHVHVGVQGADRAIAVHNALRALTPQLTALSASSPFLDGIDTGFSSVRSIIFSRNYPRANIAPIFENHEAYISHLRWLMEAGATTAPSQVWWASRPHIAHGTIELRMFDGQPDVRDTLALTALSVGVIKHLCDQYDAGELPEPVESVLIDENAWSAARYGTSALIADLPSAKLRPITEAISELITHARSANTRHELGLEAGLDRADEMLLAGSSAHWQREMLAAADGDFSVPYRAVADATMSSAFEPAFRG